MAFVPDDITLWVLLVAPGLIAVQIAIWVGVVETKLTDSLMLVVSLVSSIVVDAVFFGLYQVVYGPIRSVDTAESIFFTPRFRPELVLGLLALSVLTGLAYATAVIYDVTGRLRTWAWAHSEHYRYPGQPWEGVLRDADIVRVETTDDAIIVGRVSEYSRLNQPKELALRYPQWWDPTKGQLVDERDEEVLLFEDDIRRITVRSRIEDRVRLQNWYRETLALARDIRAVVGDIDPETDELGADAVGELGNRVDALGAHVADEDLITDDVKNKISAISGAAGRIEAAPDSEAAVNDWVLVGQLASELESRCQEFLNRAEANSVVKP